MTQFLAIYADGHTYPAKLFKPDTREYFQLIQATGRQLKDRGLAINQNDFADVYTLFCFSLEADNTSH